MTGLTPPGGWKIHAPSYPILLGFEYEVDTGNEDEDTPFDEDEFSEKLPHYVWHWESTGFHCCAEVKSHVAPLHLHRRGLREFLAITTFNTHPNGPQNDGGIHINVSRTEFTERQHNKVFSFLHDPNNYNDLLKVAGRARTKFEYFAKQHGKEGWKKPINGVYGMEKQSDHYYSIISTRKKYAFELRMFAGLPGLLVPAMEFADALFTLSPMLEGDITLTKLLNFTRNKIKYQNIYKHMTEVLSPASSSTSAPLAA